MNSNRVIDAEALLRGVGGISDELIAEAAEINVRSAFSRRRQKNLRAVFSGIAACLVLICVLSLTAALLESDGPLSSANGENAHHHSEGLTVGPPDPLSACGSVLCTVENERGSLACLGADGTSVSFLLTLNKSVGNSGEVTEAADRMCIYVELAGKRAVYGGGEASELLRVTVNGKEARDGNLPSAAGTYLITVEASALCASLDVTGSAERGAAETIAFTDFGSFIIDASGNVSPGAESGTAD